MNCPNCGFLLPDDSKFCQYCGTVLPDKVPKSDPHHQKHTKPASRVRPAALALAAVSVLLVCSLVGNLVQYGSAAKVQQELEQQLENSNATIAAQESAILELENQLEETETKYQRSEAMLLYTKAELKEAQEDSCNFDLIRSFLKKSDAGYASDQFYASTSVLILSMTGGDQTFSLTTGFSGGTYTYSLSGSSARVSFTEDSWTGNSTTIRVSPKSSGATYVTFSNNLNSQTFRVLVIVS